MQEGHHGAFAAAEIQAVVPIGAQALADAGRADLLGREIQRALEVLVNGGLAFVGERDHLIEQRDVAGLLHVLANRRHQPERVVGARRRRGRESCSCDRASG